MTSSLVKKSTVRRIFAWVHPGVRVPRPEEVNGNHINDARPFQLNLQIRELLPPPFEERLTLFPAPDDFRLGRSSPGLLHSRKYTRVSASFPPGKKALASYD